MYRVFILILSAQLALAAWCECPSTFVTYGDLITTDETAVSVKYNRKTYTDMQELIDDAILPRLPVKPLTGIQIAMQQKPLSCNTINGGVSYDTSYDIPISVVYMTQSGPKVATYIFELQAICQATTPPSTYSFFLSAVKRHEGPIEEDSGDISKFVPTSLVVDGPVENPIDESETAIYYAGMLHMFKTCLPHGPLASYGDCSSIKYGTEVRPTITVVSRPMLYMCMSISSWKDHSDTLNINQILDKALFFEFMPGNHEAAVISTVCGRSRVNYATPTEYGSFLNDFIGAGELSYEYVDPSSCDPDNILIKESTCEYGDISLSTNTADFSGQESPWTINSISGICTVPVASDCPRHKKPDVAKDYLAVIFIGVVSLLTLIAVVGVSVYGTYFYDPVKRVYKSNAIPKKPSPPPVVQFGDGIRQRQPSKAISFNHELLSSDKISQKPVEPSKAVEIQKVQETPKQAMNAPLKPVSEVPQKTLVASPPLLIKKDVQPSIHVTEKEKSAPVLERPVRSEPVIASVSEEHQRNVTPRLSIEESLQKARQLESRAEKVVPIGAIKTVAGFIPEVAAAEKIFSKAEELQKKAKPFVAKAEELHEKAKPFVAKAEEISSKFKESKEFSDKIKGIASTVNRPNLKDVLSDAKVDKKIAPLVEKAAGLYSKVEEIERKADGVGRKVKDAQKKAAPIAEKAAELATALSGKDVGAIIKDVTAPQNPLISHKHMLKSLVKHAGGEWNIANKS